MQVNQWSKSRKGRTGSNLVDRGRSVARDHASSPEDGGGQLRRLVVVAGQEATVKACGVIVAMLPGYRWAPHSLIDLVVNVGTTRGRPTGGQPARRGQARCRLRAVGWGGGLVVVRAEESSVHGKGGQQVSSGGTGRSGGCRR